MPMFFRACRHHSTKSAKWGGAFDTVCPPCLQVGEATVPLPPGSTAYEQKLRSDDC